MTVHIVSPRAAAGAAILLGACFGTPSPNSRSKAPPATVSAADVSRWIGVLAADSLEGRRTGTAGSARAARFIAREFEAAGLAPAGDSGYIQRVPLQLAVDTAGGRQLEFVADRAAYDALPPGQRVMEGNVVGVLPGADPALRGEVVLVTAHYDHLGVGRAVQGDSIYNGADDDASGTTAVIGVAKLLAAGPALKRTVVFLATTGEELGLLGTRWFIAHPPYPLHSIVANLNIEMVGRPDSLIGGTGKSWLTGYERSTMGDMLARAGVGVKPDARPELDFFERSDNIAFARLGIPAHTLSSYNLHQDYHQPGDDASKIDAEHMAQVIQDAATAVRLLGNGPRVEWKPGGRP
ncbi:MAG: M20/M25/M40 family metallo-hydrolase [Gemmatimonadota bacterium]